MNLNKAEDTSRSDEIVVATLAVGGGTVVQAL